MSRSSGNKTLDIEKIYIPASGARSSGMRWGLGEAPAQTNPISASSLFGLVSRQKPKIVRQEKAAVCV